MVQCAHDHKYIYRPAACCPTTSRFICRLACLIDYMQRYVEQQHVHHRHNNPYRRIVTAEFCLVSHRRPHVGQKPKCRHVRPVLQCIDVATCIHPPTHGYECNTIHCLQGCGSVACKQTDDGRAECESVSKVAVLIFKKSPLFKGSPITDNRHVAHVQQCQYTSHYTAKMTNFEVATPQDAGTNADPLTINCVGRPVFTHVDDTRDNAREQKEPVNKIHFSPCAALRAS